MLHRKSFQVCRSLEQSVGAGMYFAPVIKQSNNVRGLTAALSKIVLLIAIGYATAYIVRAVLNL